MRPSEFLGTALGYLLLGAFCVNIAVDPGYACPIWPSAGWALVMVVYFGARAVPAVFLGALVLNLYISAGHYLIYPFLVSCGVAVQAGVGAWLSNRIRQRDRFLNDPWRVLAYLLAAGPLACMISASLAIPVMMSWGPLAGQDFATSWFHWWIGDTLGVLALAPLGEVALLFLPQGKGKLLVFYSWPSLLTLALSALLFWQSQRSDFSYLRERFQHEAQLGQQILEQDLAQASGDLRRIQLQVTRRPEWLEGGSSFDEASLFAVTVGSGRLHGVGLIRVVPDSQRAQIEALLTARYGRPIQLMEGVPGAITRRAGKRDRYWVLMAQSPARNPHLEGLDIASLPGRRPAMERAAAQDLMTSTPLSRSWLFPTRRDAVFFFLPIYQGYPRTENQRRADLVGMISGSFYVSELTQRRLRTFLPEGVGYQLTVRDASLSFPEQERSNRVEGLSCSFEFPFAGQDWRLDFWGTPTFVAQARSHHPWLVGLIGALLSCLTATLTLLAVDRQAVVDRMVAERTADLSLQAEEASQSSLAKSRFLAVMSHEIRTPMNGVLGLGHLLLGTPLNAQQRDYVETLLTSGNSLLSILNDVLDFSKIESDRLEVEERPVDLIEVVDGALDLFAKPAHDKGLSLEFLLSDPHLETSCVQTDPTRLRQILLNLVGNAIKFTEQGKVQVELELREREWLIRVRDSGIGIPAEILERLFEPFSQADSSIARRFGGTGLGLTISKGLIERMGGRLWVESQPQKGSVFTLLLPRRDCPPQPGGQWEPLTTRFHLQVELDNPAEAALARWVGQRLGMSLQDAERTLLLCEMSAADLKRVPLVAVSDPGQEIPEALAELVISRPLRATRLAAVLRSLVSSPQPCRQQPARARLKILLAEDNRVNQKVAQRLLAQMGHEVTVVGDGAQAVAEARQSGFDLILMDIHMPEMDGLEAIQILRAEGHRLPIVALTALASLEDEQMCLNAGATAFLSKPFDPDRLEQLLQASVELSRGLGCP
ncbi:response regulator [bacterium]|nr:response regulator [bacterium]